MKAFVRWRKLHFLFVDAALVTLVVAIVFGGAFIFMGAAHLTIMFNGIRTTLYGTAFAGCAGLLGFIITTTTITDAVIQNPQWEEFRKSLAYSQVQDIYFNTIRWLGLGSLAFLTFLIIDTDDHPQLSCGVISIWLICVLASRLWRSINALETLLRDEFFQNESCDKIISNSSVYWFYLRALVSANFGYQVKSVWIFRLSLTPADRSC